MKLRPKGSYDLGQLRADFAVEEIFRSASFAGRKGYTGFENISEAW
jgi:hypothetical protein